jgi:broad specificity phosphatase PhoE
VTTTRLVAVAAAASPALAGTFPPDAPLDAPTVARVHDHALDGRFDRVACAPDTAARQTASALGLDPVTDELALRACDFGTWAGQPVAGVQHDEPEAFAAWVRDVEVRPPGGESLADVLARVEAWLVTVPGPARVAVVASALVVRALVVAAIRAPAATMAHVDVAPLGVARLDHHDGRWRLHSLHDRFGMSPSRSGG